MGRRFAVAGNLTGTGSAEIDGVAELNFGAAVHQDITFDANASGMGKIASTSGAALRQGQPRDREVEPYSMGRSRRAVKCRFDRIAPPARA